MRRVCSFLPVRCIIRKNHNFSYAVLSAENRNRTVEALKSFKPISDGKPKSTRKAAVLVPLCIHNGELSLLLTVRAMTLRNNRGQVAFPGGMEDTNDRTLLDTALRETDEEIGISPSSVDVWGPGPPVGRPDMTVTPYLGFVGDLDPTALSVNHQEVHTAFTASLSSMCEPKNFKTTVFRYSSLVTLPVFITPEFRIWGLTAVITHSILAALLPHHYKNKIPRRILSSTSLPSTSPS